MTKGELKFLVYVRVTGGYPSNDAMVWPEDIDTYIVPAVNFANTKQYYIDKQSEEGDRDVRMDMLQIFENVAVAFSDSRQRKYSNLPATFVSLPKGRGLVFVGYMNGRPFIPGRQNEEGIEEYYTQWKQDVVTYYLEGKKVYYYNIPTSTDKVLMKGIVAVTDLKDEDDLGLIPGSEPEVVDLMVQFYTGQRAMPKDYVLDTKDTNFTGKQ